METLKYVGKPFVREDAFDKARGKTQYTCDRKIQGMLYGKLVLSEKAHASIQICTEKAEQVPGVVRIFTHKDVPEKKYNPHNWTAGTGVFEDMYILSEKARYVGDHLALVVGETREAVEEGAALVELHYEEEPAVIGYEAAREAGDHVAFEKEVKCGDFEHIQQEEVLEIETAGSTQAIHHGPIEPHIALADIDETGNLVVWTPCQTVFMVRYHICSLLDLPYTKVRVVKAVMGGSFGGKGLSVVEPACAFAAWTLRRPVMLYMDRPADITATRKRNPSCMTVRTLVTREGKILGRYIDSEFDGGAYYTNASAIAMAFSKKLFRLYRIPNQTVHAKTYYTNTTPGGSCRGYGSPQAHAVTEINLDQAAKKLQMDPCEFRLKNVVLPGDKDPSGGTDLGDARIKECILKGMEAFDWKNRREHIKEKDTDRYAWGIGMACGTHGNGYKGGYPDFTNVMMQIHPDGSAEVRIAVHDQGCGTVMTMQQIAAEALHMDVYRIKVPEADTFISPYDAAGTQASRVTYVCGRAVQKAGEQLLDKIKNACLALYGWEKEKQEALDGEIIYQGTEKKSYGEISIEYEKTFHRYLHTELEYEPEENPGVYCADFAEVKIDKYTGLVEVTDLLAVHDVGQCMNRTLSEGQVEGGAQMSLGQALFEEISYDKKGGVRSQNFSKYHMINAPEMPEVKSIFIENHHAQGPYGAKSLGEVVAVAPAPAVANAINFALGSCFTDYPITPEKIVDFLEKQSNR
ncbi:MAG TPA: molybdopterin-dependent oxidoreductase [Candidatus Blautia avicola]|uniref:Molybdopterin-dependent oxidoreductase n=1 Tax=Candidatus Blautia avicola TaxID=2838483 RepID=A0A9D2TV16_9FIRM|nr:molybdopterin-dependent oxidoreductase [Candidatus Blautia avicola]